MPARPWGKHVGAASRLGGAAGCAIKAGKRYPAPGECVLLGAAEGTTPHTLAGSSRTAFPEPRKREALGPRLRPDSGWRRPGLFPAGLGWGRPTYPQGCDKTRKSGASPNPEVSAAPAVSQGMLSRQGRFSALGVGSFCTTHPQSFSNYFSQARGSLASGRESHTPYCFPIGCRPAFISLHCFIG